jgi:glutamine amidotransferase
VSPTIAIVDYGLGNLASVAGALERIGARPVPSSNLNDMAAADGLIVPGVGAFGDGMRNLRDRGLVEGLTSLVEKGKPVLGICLGAQLLCRESEEFGRHAGLGWVAATVKKLAPADPKLRVPHVGWNELQQTRSSRLLSNIPSTALFYYVHSFGIHADDEAIVTGTCDHGMAFVATYERGNIFGTQFHPEKSQQHGLSILENFLGCCRC